jgi:hypothetical protein
LNKIQFIHCFLLSKVLYNSHNAVTEICCGLVIEDEPERSETETMLKQIFSLTHFVSAPALASALLALYGVALVTHTVAGINIV